MGFYLRIKETGHAGGRAGLGWAHICLSASLSLLMFLAVSVCLSMGGFGGVGRGLVSLCVWSYVSS